MMNLFSDYAYNLVGLFVALVVIFIAFFKWKTSLWKRHGLPVSSSNGMFYMISHKKSLGEYLEKVYNEARAKGLKHIGSYFFLKAAYTPIDPEILKHILTKNFSNFMDRGMYFNEEKDPLSAHLFNIEGEKWKILRQKLSPTFTSGQMKMMFQVLVDCGEQLREYLKKGDYTKESIDIKEVLARFTTDIIGSCAFGIQCNTLENPDAEFRKYGKLIFEPSVTEIGKFMIGAGLPRNFLHKIGFTTTRKDITKFFTTVVEETINYREQHHVDRKDFMQLLLQLKNKGTLEGETQEYINKNVAKLTLNEIAAQAFVFYLAGFETSSTAMTFAIYEMALNQTIQNKAREEINAVLAKYDGKVTYEGVMEMSYLQRVLDESMRKYPPVPFLNRNCEKDFKIPGTDFTLPAGSRVSIAVAGIHHDPEYYPNPEKFDPERFTEENKNKRPNYTYFPFGDGPRICIGMRFGIVQAKMGLITLLRDYRIKLDPKTAVPLTLDPTCIITTAKGDVHVTMERINTQIPAA